VTESIPLVKVSLVDQVVDVVRDRIASGVMVPGETVRIEQLARDLGVSRTPVREAIPKLEAIGLLVRRAGHAATVFMPNRKEVTEYYEMRRALEPLAARLALPGATSGQKEAARRLADAMDSIDAPNWFQLNRDFHRTLYESADRPYLLEMIENLIARSEPYQRLYFETHDLEETQRGHRQMVDAFLREDEDALVAAISDHLDHVVYGMLEAIQQTTGTPASDAEVPTEEP
jgi:DNA-binding GntR family transcriptional regulator